MPSLSDTLNLNSCVWFDSYDKNNSRFSIISGLLFFTGWWLIIDANVVYSEYFNVSYYIWGTLGTISLIMVNSIPRTDIEGDLMGGLNVNSSRACLFIGFVLGFASVIASFGIYFANVKPDDNKIPGVELLLQNVLIFVSSILLKFFRNEEPQ